MHSVNETRAFSLIRVRSSASAPCRGLTARAPPPRPGSLRAPREWHVEGRLEPRMGDWADPALWALLFYASPRAEAEDVSCTRTHALTLSCLQSHTPSPECTLRSRPHPALPGPGPQLPLLSPLPSLPPRSPPLPPPPSAPCLPVVPATHLLHRGLVPT